MLLIVLPLLAPSPGSALAQQAPPRERGAAAPGPEALLETARERYREGEYQEALVRSDYVLAFSPENFDALLLKANALRRLGRYAAARATLEEAPRGGRAGEAVTRALARVAYAEAQRWLAFRDLEAARERFDEALALDPGFVPAAVERMHTIAAEDRDLERNRSVLEGLLDRLDELEDANEEDPRPYAFRPRVLAHLHVFSEEGDEGKVEEAREEAEKALERDPDSEDARAALFEAEWFLASIRLAEDDYEESLEHADRALAAVAGERELYLRHYARRVRQIRGRALMALGEHERARGAYRRAAETAAWEASRRAALHLREGDREAALEQLERAVRLDPWRADHHLEKAALLVDLGRYAAAHRSVSYALAVAPDHPVAHVARRELERRAGSLHERPVVPAVREAMKRYHVGDYEGGLSSIDAHLAVRDDGRARSDPVALAVRAYLLFALDRLEESDKALSAAVAAAESRPAGRRLVQPGASLGWLSAAEAHRRDRLEEEDARQRAAHAAVASDPFHADHRLARLASLSATGDLTVEDLEVELAPVRRLLERDSVLSTPEAVELSVAIWEAFWILDPLDWDRGTRHLEAAVEAAPGEAYGPIALAQQYYTKEKEGDAREALERARTMARAAIERGDRPTYHRRALAEAADREGRYLVYEKKEREEAREKFEEAIAHDPTRASAHLMRARAIRWYVIEEEKEGEEGLRLLAQARHSQERAASLAPRWRVARDQAWWITNAEGICLRKDDRPDEAVAKHRQAIQALPKVAFFRKSLGYALVEVGEDRGGDQKDLYLARADTMAAAADYLAGKKGYSDDLRQEIQGARTGFFSDVLSVATSLSTGILAAQGLDPEVRAYLTAFNLTVREFQGGEVGGVVASGAAGVGGGTSSFLDRLSAALDPSSPALTGDPSAAGTTESSVLDRISGALQRFNGELQRGLDAGGGPGGSGYGSRTFGAPLAVGDGTRGEWRYCIRPVHPNGAPVGEVCDRFPTRQACESTRAGQQRKWSAQAAHIRREIDGGANNFTEGDYRAVKSFTDTLTPCMGPGA